MIYWYWHIQKVLWLHFRTKTLTDSLNRTVADIDRSPTKESEIASTQKTEFVYSSNPVRDQLIDNTK